MTLNSGTLVLIIIFGSAFVLLVITLLISLLVGKRKGKMPVVGKVFSLIFAILCVAGSIITPLGHYNYMDINLKYGTFKGEGSFYNYYLVVHRDMIELKTSTSSQAEKQGTYTLNMDILTITYKDNSEVKYVVAELGTELYQDGARVFHYMKESINL